MEKIEIDADGRMIDIRQETDRRIDPIGQRIRVRLDQKPDAEFGGPVGQLPDTVRAAPPIGSVR